MIFNQISKNKWIKPGLYTTFDKISVVLLGFVNFFILARVLTKNDFGVWVLFTGLVSIFETLREGFIKQPMIAYLASTERGTYSRIGSASLSLNIIYSLLVSLIIILLSIPLEIFWNAYPLAALLKIYAITNLLFIPFSHFEYLQQSRFDFKGIFFSHFLRSIILTIVVIILVIVKVDIHLPFLAFISLVANFMGLLVCMKFGWQYRHKLVKPSIENLKRIAGFGQFSFGTNLASLTIRNMDSWMLGKMLSAVSVAAYNPAIRIANLVEIPTLTVANLVFTKMAQNYQVDDHVYSSQLYERSVGFLLALMIPLAVILFIFSNEIVVLIAGSKYLESGYLLKITAFYTIFIPFGRQFGILLDSIRRPSLNFYFIIASAIINIVLMYFFINQWGIKGAAFATLLTYLIRFVSQQVLLNRMLGISTISVFRKVPAYYAESFKGLWAFIMKHGAH